MASPTKITTEVVERVAGAFRAGADWALAARIAGVTRAALYKYADRHPSTKQDWQEARDAADDIIVKTLYDKAKKGDVTAMIFWLKNRRPGEWRDRRDFTASVRVGTLADLVAEAAREGDGKP